MPVVEIRNGPGVEFVKVVNDKRLAQLKAFGQPFGERKRVAVLVLFSLESNNAESRKLDERLSKAQ
jgi:hypothetical protein